MYRLFRIQNLIQIKIPDLGKLVPHFKYNLIFMKSGIQSREHTLLLNMLFGIDDLVSNVGPTIEVLSNFLKFSTMNKCYILKIKWSNILKLKYAFLLFIRLEIEIAVKVGLCLLRRKLYVPFLWIGFNCCLKARATLRRQYTFYH